MSESSDDVARVRDFVGGSSRTAVATYEVVHGRHVGDWPGSPASGGPVVDRVRPAG